MFSCWSKRQFDTIYYLKSFGRLPRESFLETLNVGFNPAGGDQYNDEYEQNIGESGRALKRRTRRERYEMRWCDAMRYDTI